MISMILFFTCVSFSLSQVRHDDFILDVLDQQLVSCEATLLVMGSQALTTSTIEAFMSSVTLACMRRFTLPLLLLTSNAKSTPLPIAGVCMCACLFAGDWGISAGLM